MSSVQLHDFDADQLAAFRENITAEFNDLKAKNLKLDLTRGKPSSEQLDFADDLLALPGKGDYKAADGTDVRNYGGLTGIQDIRAIWAELMGIPVEQVLAGDSSSLNIMFDVISWSHTFGNNDSERPWKDEETVKWICPVPGYDRHFSISERFGFEMITVPMNEDGPDVAAVAELVKDPQVKGMWVVPTFSNPTGYSVSEDVAKQLAELETAAPDFRIVWDNAYAVHTLTDEFPEILDIVSIAEAAGNPNRFWAFTSTSKITLAGAGVSFFITSEANRSWYTDIAGIRGIGPNKVNQLAHARYFGDAAGVRAV
ncbi:MAG: aminotransferase, partial [Corynebacterium sp.]|nr:aminotransferase [Corynebacterium sp.]